MKILDGFRQRNFLRQFIERGKICRQDPFILQLPQRVKRDAPSLSAPGKNISEVEIQNISPYGVWIYALGKEYFLDYENYPWFKKVNLDKIFNIKLVHEHHLYWPELDVDLEIECLESPEKFPLRFQPQ